MKSFGAKATRAAAIRNNLNHPVVDSDGHYLETIPALDVFMEDYVKKTGGQELWNRMRRTGYHFENMILQPWNGMNEQERAAIWMPRPPWWGIPADTLDLATARLPRLLYERLDDFGIDFTVLFPTAGLTTGMIIDDEIRQVACSAFNTYTMDLFGEYSDRMTPAAVIPSQNPDEAIAELEHAVCELGFKAILFDSIQWRYVGQVAEEQKNEPRWGSGTRTRMDNLCIDSEYDYDPFWRRCVELKVSPLTHTPGQNWGSRTSLTNWVYNHIGNFASTMEASSKALFMSGVTQRFPELSFGFLEAGVAWACTLLTDIVSHWEKRGGESIQQYNPARVDKALMRNLVNQYGDESMKAVTETEYVRVFDKRDPQNPQVDDFKACGIKTKDDLYERFIPKFYFGCEADDPMVGLAYQSELYDGNTLRPVFSSDFGHWDVTDMNEILEEAYELVEHKVVNEDQFREFMFENPVRLYANLNRDFFKGTRIEQVVEAFIKGE